MLEYDFIYKKGILFIRLKGDINKKTSKVLVDEIDPLVLDNGIKNVVLNVGKLNNIDNDGILAIYDCYLKLTQESDVSICEIPSYLRSKFEFLLKYIKEREDELTILTRN